MSSSTHATPFEPITIISRSISLPGLTPTLSDLTRTSMIPRPTSIDTTAITVSPLMTVSLDSTVTSTPTNQPTTIVVETTTNTRRRMSTDTLQTVTNMDTTATGATAMTTGTATTPGSMTGTATGTAAAATTSSAGERGWSQQGTVKKVVAALGVVALLLAVAW